MHSISLASPQSSYHKMSKYPRHQSSYLFFIYAHLLVILFHLVTLNTICMEKTLKFRLLAQLFPQTAILYFRWPLYHFFWISDGYFKCNMSQLHSCFPAPTCFPCSYLQLLHVMPSSQLLSSSFFFSLSQNLNPLSQHIFLVSFKMCLDLTIFLHFLGPGVSLFSSKP